LVEPRLPIDGIELGLLDGARKVVDKVLLKITRVNRLELMLNNHQPPTTNHQPPTTNHQPPSKQVLISSQLYGTGCNPNRCCAVRSCPYSLDPLAQECLEWLISNLLLQKVQELVASLVWNTAECIIGIYILQAMCGSTADVLGWVANCT
jgi:hypothetical protein